MLKIIAVETEEHLAQAVKLLEEYAAWLGHDHLCFENFEKELTELPGRYAPPGGRLLLAVNEVEPAGCAALRKFDKDSCEMKRLYVRPTFRGQGVGKALASRIIEEAQQIGYARVLLDTLPAMQEAVGMYRALGFKNIKPYRDNPIAGAMFMKLCLTQKLP